MEHLSTLAEYWILVKIWLRDGLDLHDDALHMHFSLVGLFVIAVILRKRPDSIYCWLALFAAEMLNEYIDVLKPINANVTFSSSFDDIFNTMLWPTIILVTGRFLFPPRQKIPTQKLPANQEQREAENALESLGDLADQPLK